MIAGRRPTPGTVRKVNLKVSETAFHQPARIPVTIVCGKDPGPTIFVTAAVHGDEVNGVPIVRRLLDRLEPDKMAGTFVGVPVVNRFGFPSGDRYLPDRRDLNRHFPGRPDGSMANRMADALFTKVLSKCDYGIDLHTAATGRANLCHVRGDVDDPQVKAMLKAFGTPIMMSGAGPTGALRRALTEAGVPTIIFEAGEPARFESHVADVGYRGCLRVMRSLGMLPQKVRRPPLQVLVRRSEWLRSDHGGIVDLKVEPGDLVNRGKHLAHIHDPYGRHVDAVVAPKAGVVIGVATNPVTNPGTAIVHLGLLDKTLASVRDFVAGGGDLGHIHIPPARKKAEQAKTAKAIKAKPPTKEKTAKPRKTSKATASTTSSNEAPAKESASKPSGKNTRKSASKSSAKASTKKPPASKGGAKSDRAKKTVKAARSKSTAPAPVADEDDRNPTAVDDDDAL